MKVAQTSNKRSRDECSAVSSSKGTEPSAKKIKTTSRNSGAGAIKLSAIAVALNSHTGSDFKCPKCEHPISAFVLNSEELMWMCTKKECIYPMDRESDLDMFICKVQDRDEARKRIKRHLLNQKEGKATDASSTVLESIPCSTMSFDCWDETSEQFSMDLLGPGFMGGDLGSESLFSSHLDGDREAASTREPGDCGFDMESVFGSEDVAEGSKTGAKSIATTASGTLSTSSPASKKQ